jgi:hypothetical protein
MNRIDTIKLMTVLQTAYPQFYAKKTAEEMNDAISLYMSMFEDEPAELVAMAVKALIKTRTSTWPPSIGEINEKIMQITQPEEMTELEAWAFVSKAIRNSAYNSAEEFEKLPPVVQRLVGSPSQLREWGQMDSDTVNSVVASNFQRSYKARAKNERDFLALPSSVKSYMAALSDGMKMPELPDVVEDPKRINELLRRVAEQ